MVPSIPQIYAIFLVRFHATRGPEIEFVVPNERASEIYGEGPLPDKSYPSAQNRQQEFNEPQSDSSYNQPFKKAANEERFLESSYFRVKSIHQFSNNIPEEGIIDFNALSSILMPKQILYERLVKILFKNYKVMGFPIGVTGEYERNALIFNCCFVFKKNEIYKSSLKHLVEKLMEDLNMFGESQILEKLPSIAPDGEDTNVEFNIKLFPTFEKLIEIKSYHVPILIINPEDLIQGHEDNDMGMERVIRHLNNINHVRRISQLSDIPEKQVILILQHLQYYGCLRFTEIFQFTNTYVTTTELNNILESDELQADCIEFVTSSKAKFSDLPTIPTIFRLYSCLKGDMSLSKWVVNNNINWNQIDIRKFIMFGVLNDGSRHIDELAFILEMETLSLISFFEANPECVALISR
ncbi:hypothetical protein BB560_003175 [Smittium megazygosporum]|uniref:Nitrogen permease regulator 2 n=1 Tax=Smittium megazygosporum TaxID=133381 RepID=A0A2T9ZCP7_9FUNG|nr:hypothetical protein BB560_003175 [Smittium megazygosporum]